MKMSSLITIPGDNDVYRDDGNGGGANAGTGRRRNRRRNTQFDPVDENHDDIQSIDVMDFLQSLNQTDTVASVFLKDTSERKKNFWQILSKQSATSKLISDAVETNRESIPVNVVTSINILKLASNIYDNNYSIINQQQQQPIQG
jgi:hypothetical protein